MADGPEPGLLQESEKGFNLTIDLKERLPTATFFFIRVAAHLGPIGRNYSTSGNYILHLGVVGEGIRALKLHKPREHYLCRHCTKIEAREGILVMAFQGI